MDNLIHSGRLENINKFIPWLVSFNNNIISCGFPFQIHLISLFMSYLGISETMNSWKKTVNILRLHNTRCCPLSYWVKSVKNNSHMARGGVCLLTEGGNNFTQKMYTLLFFNFHWYLVLFRIYPELLILPQMSTLNILQNRWKGLCKQVIWNFFIYY